MEKQVHSKFKLFVSKFNNEEKLSEDLIKQVEKFGDSYHSIAPKSIGVEFLEDTQEVIITLGYAEEENVDYKISLETAYIGPFSNDVLSTLETSLEKEADKHQNVICHELFVTHTKQMFAVFLTATKK